MHKINFLRTCNATITHCKVADGRYEYTLTTPLGKMSGKGSTFTEKDTLTSIQAMILVGDTFLLDGLREVFTEEQIAILMSQDMLED